MVALQEDTWACGRCNWLQESVISCSSMIRALHRLAGKKKAKAEQGLFFVSDSRFFAFVQVVMQEGGIHSLHNHHGIRSENEDKTCDGVFVFSSYERRKRNLELRRDKKKTAGRVVQRCMCRCFGQ